MKGEETMSHEDFSPLHRTMGRVAALSVFILCVIYAIILILGFLSLKSPQDPIGDPYVSILELLIILLSPLMVIAMIAVHAYAPRDVKAYSFTALIFMIIMTGITSSVHFAILTVSRQIEAAGLTQASLFFSFKWPSVVYTLDILAWDWFFTLAMFFSAPVFKDVGLEKIVRYILIVSGFLSFVGLLGVPLAIMNVESWFIVRNIGIVGYALVAPIAFLLMGILFGRTQPMLGDTKRK